MRNKLEDKFSTKINDFEEKVVQIKRVSKKVRGGNTIGFTALVVTGDKIGRVGYGYGRSSNVSEAISKAVASAKKSLKVVKIKEGTISHEVRAKIGSADVFLMPAPKGSGIIAGGTVRIVLELAGYKNVSSRMLGSNNKLSNVRCTIKALGKLKE